MMIAHYEFQVSEDHFNYEFWSEGPRGRIKKVIMFTRFTLQGKFCFNLSFGDLDEDGICNDFINSNNHDAEKVLATVARAVLSFTNIHPNALIYAEGSTASRTRRYQMGINKFWKEIEPDFDVFGLVENEGFKPFRSGRNYMAFAVKRKNSNFII